MNTAADNANDQSISISVHGSGSIAHEIIGEFLVALEKSEGYAEVAKNLKTAIFEGKPSEISLRIAMFGENAL